jgi:sensor histidine kinase YesM
MKRSKKISKLKSFANGTHMLREENILLAKKETVYSIGRKIQNDRGRDIGYILFEFLQNDFNNIIHNAHVDSIVVTDKFKNVILSTNNTLINEIGKLALNDMGAGWQEFRATNYYVYRSNILNNGITIYTLTIMNPVNESYILGLAFMILIFVFLLLLTRITARKMAKNKSKSLDELLAAIKRVQKGDLNAFVDIKTNDEFEIIGAYYNKMLIKINKLIDENEEQAERNKIVEIKQLESQFNPHFLFNTLEIIKYTIRTAPENAVKILVSMSNLLRYSINNKEQKVELQNDIEHIKDYMLIQKFRFENSLNYELEMESGVEECIVPKLTIQPFIENSIKYGFLDREALNIRLRCFFQEVNIAFGAEKDLILEISNDGKHIDEQQMSEIKELLHGADNKTNHIGIYNIHRRVQLMYGKEYGVSIENKYENECDSGVVVTIKLPVIFEETGVIDD